MQLILRGKRFGFSLEDIRQLLDMYNRNGSNQAQLARSFDLGQDRLAQMKAQRDELSIAITELEVELQGAGAALASLRAAAE